MTTSRSLRSLAELVVIVAAALFFALTIQAFAVKPYVIPSESMAPTLVVGQRLLVDRFSHHVGAEEALDLLPDAQLRVLPGTGFLLAYDDPVGVARELAAFIR